MGNCESCIKPKTSHRNNTQKANSDKIGEQNANLNNSVKKNVIEQDAILGKVLPISSGKEEAINNQMKFSICKINENEKYGTGFFCKIPFPNEFTLLPVLITNKSLINEDYLLKIRKIDIIFDNDKEERTIYISSERKIYSCKNYDIIFIEIFPKLDEIKEQFLEVYMKMPEDIIYDLNDIDNKINKKINNINNNIYIIQYINEKSCTKSYGIIKNIHEGIIEHNCSQEFSGPILLIRNLKLIGINRKLVKVFY